MKNFSFPIFKTKMGIGKKHFSLDDPAERRKYFEYKVGREIEAIREYLRHNTFVGYLLGKKNSGKGTYAKLFIETIGPERIAHISVGDVVRDAHDDLRSAKKKKELIAFLKRRYRGFITIEQALGAILGRGTTTLVPNEVTLALVEREIDRHRGKALLIDGFPRNLDQVGYSLYFRSLIGYRDDPDFFVFIDLPNTVIDERMKNRVVCPKCQTPRSLRLLRTKQVGYDKRAKAFFLICDNPPCSGARMLPKEGDELGTAAIRKRVKLDGQIMRMLMGLEGVPKIFLRNSIPVKTASRFADPYELTPMYDYEWDEEKKIVQVTKKPWIVSDDDKVPSYSLLAPTVVVALIKQTARVLGL